MADDTAHDGVAIIGMAGRFPGAGDLAEFWANLRDGVESIVPLTDEELLAAGVAPEVFGRPHYVKAAPRFEGVDLFDAEFFGYTAREARAMDPQHRLFLEKAWEALEDAGYDTAQHDGSVGVFGGASTTAYLDNIMSNLDLGARIRGENVGLGFELAFLTSRVSYKLDLRGPSFPVQTACSTGLVAVHTACQSLLNYECDMALSGAVSYKVPENTGYPHQEGSFLSPDGHIRPFDAEARGTVFGNGVGVVVLKRLEDALADGDTVHAVIKGSAVNNDGAVKSSFTAPTVAGQADVIVEALAAADLDPEDVDYVEAHGSGTVIGDSIEVQALTRAFDGAGSCALGSVKGNVGHLDAASGIAGLIKTTLALEHETLPPSVNYRGANPDVDFAASPFHVQATRTAWPRTDRARRAGVSAFGFGGTNAHVVLEEAPADDRAPEARRGTETLVLSARTPEALELATDRLAAFLRRERPDLADAAHTLARGRRAFPHRRAVVGHDVDGVADALESRATAGVVTGEVPPETPTLVFLFSGQGSQHPGMGKDLYDREPVFRAAVDECADHLRPVLDADIREVVFGADAARLTETRWAQPALFTVEYALAALWRAWGVEPAAMIGHSLGEWVAACVAGVFSLPDALALVALRGKLMQAQNTGAMLNVIADRDAVETALPAGLSLAAHNGPRDCVVSGPHDAVDAFAEQAEDLGWTTQPVATSHAFHSTLMAPMVDEFVVAVAARQRHAPTIPFVSNTTGDWITDEEARDPDHWGRQILACVEFTAGVRTAVSPNGTVFLEIGPGQAFGGLARRVTAGDAGTTALSSLPHKRDRRTASETVHHAVGRLWTLGVAPDWAAHFGPGHRRIPLPTYPFDRKRHWLDPQVPQVAAATTPGPHPLLDEVLLRSAGQSVFLTRFAVERHWVLSEHRLLGEAIVPGTTYLEMARAAASLHFGQTVAELVDVAFLVPLLVRDDGPRTAHTTIRERGEGLAEFTVASHEPATDRWTTHVQGSVSVRPLATTVPRQDIPALRERCAAQVVDVGAAQSGHRVMEFGERWVGSLRTVHVGVRAALGPLELPERYHAECADHVLHPALLDLATGFGGFAVLGPDDRVNALADRDFFLPVGYDSLRVHAPMPARGVSFVQPHPGHDGGAEVRKVDVLVCDESGAVAVEITGFTAKRVADARRTVARLRPHTRHHALQWVPAPDAPERRSVPGRVLVVAEPGATALGAELRAHGAHVTEAVLDPTWTAVGPDRYRVPPGAEGFDRLLDALGDLLPDEVVHVAAPVDGGAPLTPTALERHLRDGVHSLFHLAKCLSERGAVPRRISVVAPSVARVTGREGTTAAVHATLFGLAKVIGQENQGTEVLCVDVEADTAPAAVCAELLGPRTPAAVALRGGTRYVAELAAVDLRESPAARPDGTYLVTGGLGGLGLAVALHLGRTVPGLRLALVGRTAPPHRDRWDDVTADSKEGRQVAALRELADNGVEVRTYQADVADLAAMTDVVARIGNDLGRIGCVVHAAGVAGDGFLFRKDAETFRRTLDPKVLGAAVLDLVTLDDPPERMITFGSTVAVFGAAGQSDYTAANGYLDHFAEERTARGRPTTTAAWSDWLDTGMAFDHGVRRDTGFFRSLSTEDGLASFDEVLAAGLPTVVVGEVNYARLGDEDADGLAELLDRAPLVLSAPIRQAVADARAAVRREAAEEIARPDGGPELSGHDDGRYSGTERALARIWARELDLTALNVHDSSFALGVDSLAALRIAQNIQKTMDVRVSMVDLFRHVTVAELAGHLESTSAEG